MKDNQGICRICGGILYLYNDIFLCCETCGREYNCLTGDEVIEDDE